MEKERGRQRGRERDSIDPDLIVDPRQQPEGKVSWKVFVLFVVFGVGSWITINGVFVQLPILFKTLPEGYAIAAYMGLAVQMSNIAPTLFVFFSSKFKVNIDYVVFIIVIFGILTTMFLSLFWHHKTLVGHQEHSIAFLVLVAIAGMVDCTTSVVYLPVVSQYKNVYASALAAGAGGIGVICGLLSFAQNTSSDNPNFNTSSFFVIIAFLMFVSGVAFALIRYTPFGKQEKREVYKTTDDELPLLFTVDEDKQFSLVRGIFGVLVVLALLSLCQNGINVSLKPLLFRRYQHSDTMMMWGINLAFIVDPVASFLTTFRNMRIYQVKILSISWICLSCYSVYISLNAVQPPFSHYEYGGISVVILAMLISAALAYTKTMCYLVVHREVTDRFPKLGERAFKYMGIAIQIGSLIGSLVLFILIEFSHVFLN